MSGIRVDGVDAVLRSPDSYQCYVFAGKKYVLVKYTVGNKDDVILDGPNFITDWIPDFEGTNFANRIDCAFGTDSKHAFLFSGKECAQINFVDAEIFQRPDPIIDVFPKLSGTVFAKGIDAAINSSNNVNEFFIFKKDQCACLNYVTKKIVMKSTPIREVFPSVTPTILKYRVGAAFTTHQEGNRAFLFQGEYYVYFDFTRGADKLISNEELLVFDNWPALRILFPSKE